MKQPRRVAFFEVNSTNSQSSQELLLTLWAKALPKSEQFTLREPWQTVARALAREMEVPFGIETSQLPTHAMNRIQLASALAHEGDGLIKGRFFDHSFAASASPTTREWAFQWMLIERFLPAISDASILAYVKASGAMLYQWFLREIDHEVGSPLPVPLEFAVAALRPDIGHTVSEIALREGEILQLPTAQKLIDGLGVTIGQMIPLLDRDILVPNNAEAGQPYSEISEQTPLWFYLQKEAHHFGKGTVFGPLGTLLIASTVLGVVINDPDSYWHAAGDETVRWHPKFDAPNLTMPY